MLIKNLQTFCYLLLCVLILSCQTSQKVVDSPDLSKTETNTTDAIDALTDEQKDATNFTKHYNDSIAGYLDIEGRKDDFDSADAGKLEGTYNEIIKDSKGGTVYDMTEFDFLQDSADPTVNPSLWRQSDLNSRHGVYELKEGLIYQVRAFDLANMTFVKGEEGWIIIDPLTTKETAAAAIDAVEKALGINEELNVKAVIFTHSHLDHFGGILGVAKETEFCTSSDTGCDKIKIYAPEGFFEEAVSENVMAGSAMGRRATLMYGNNLKKGPKGTVGSGLGTTTAVGTSGILEATISIANFEPDTLYVAGTPVDFFYTPSSEAPAEMMFYFPTYKAFCQAENLSRTFHNLYTLRGAKVRDGLKWSKYIDKAIEHYGDIVEISFGTHHWPTTGQADIKEYWEGQRDLFRFTHDQTLRLANKGFTPREIAEMLKLPTALDTAFYNRGYYGSLSHNIKAQYQLYFGWFDGVPSNLNPLPPTKAGTKYVELVGGPVVLLEEAIKSFDKGEYRWVAEIVNHLVFADPSVYNSFSKGVNSDDLRMKAKWLLADAYEQMGYQAESGPWRNFYLAGASELRNGVPEANFSTMSPDMVAGMPIDLLLDYMAMRFTGSEGENAEMSYNYNLTITDEDNETYYLILKHGVLTPRKVDEFNDEKAIEVNLAREEFLELCFNAGQDNFQTDDPYLEAQPVEFQNFLLALDPISYWFNIVEPGLSLDDMLNK